MHAALRNEFNNLKELALKKNVSLALIETQLETVAFISSEKKLVCLAIVEDEIHNMLNCYKVNKNKWAWAEDEGFTLTEDLPRDIADEILIKFKSPTEYLSYLNLR
jgi:dihydroneopterin aldolase